MNTQVNQADRSDLLTTLQTNILYTFNDRELLERALTHSSITNEHPTQEHNERLEFLGDAVLELCISHTLYTIHTKLREGSLTKLRSQLVNTTSLACLAKKLGIQEVLQLGHGEELQGGRSRDSVLSDAFEAVLAAVYLEGGFDAAQKSVNHIFRDLFSAVQPVFKKDPKTHLQEVIQQRFKTIPTYTLTACTGPDHNKTFTIEVQLPDKTTFTAQGQSCKKAEQSAAVLALQALGEID